MIVTTGGDKDGTARIGADEWIVGRMLQLLPAYDVQVVTAKKDLRKKCYLKNAKAINPFKFWR